MADISKININGNDYDINASYAASAGNIEGFSYMTTAKPGWGTLADASYGPVCTFSAPGGSDGAFCYKNGQIYMQVDGFLYQDEGKYRCIDEGSIGNQSVNYANSAGSASVANQLNGREPTLSIGDESCNIDVKQHPNEYAFSKLPLYGLRNAIRWNWYDDYWEIGSLRGGSRESVGFGFVFNGDGKSYIDTEGAYHGKVITPSGIELY